MKVYFVFLLVLVFGVVSSHGRTSEYNTVTTKPYDEFFLVQQWPASFCSAAPRPCPHPILPYFTVHGLWAQKKSGHPVTCTGETFDILRLHRNTKLDMTKFWPNLFGQDENKSFWGHEYNKHASCISPFQNDQEKYFSSTLMLAKKYNVTAMLLNAGIHHGMKHSISDIKNAISCAINVNPMLQCNKAKDGTFQLYQIYLCIDKTASTLQHCQERVQDRSCPTQNNGNTQILFP